PTATNNAHWCLFLSCNSRLRRDAIPAFVSRHRALTLAVTSRSPNRDAEDACKIRWSRADFAGRFRNLQPREATADAIWRTWRPTPSHRSDRLRSGRVFQCRSLADISRRGAPDRTGERLHKSLPIA